MIMRRLKNLLMGGCFIASLASVPCLAGKPAQLVSSPRQAVDLLDTYQDAVRNDPTFHKAAADWHSAQTAPAIARASLLPGLSFGGSADWASALASRKVTGPVSNSQLLSANISQPLFNFAAWQALRSANWSVRAATANYFYAQQDLMIRVVAAYFNILRAHDVLRFTKAQKKALARELRTKKEQYRVGLKAITDVYDAQSQYDKIAAETITDQNLLEDSLEQLRAITGRYYIKVKGLHQQVPLKPPMPSRIDAWSSMAVKQNYTLQAAHMASMAAHSAIAEMASTRLPTLSAGGSYEYTRQSEDVSNATVVHSQQLLGGLSLSFPIFQGGLVFASTTKARADYQSSLDTFEYLYREVVSQTRQSFLAVNSGASRIKADAQAIKSARNELRATRAAYQVGTRTIVDVLDSLSNLYQTQQVYANDQYDYINNLVLLKADAGTLKPSDLMNINRWLRKVIRVG